MKLSRLSNSVTRKVVGLLLVAMGFVGTVFQPNTGSAQGLSRTLVVRTVFGAVIQEAGHDEPDLYVDGKHIWNGDIGRGQWVQLDKEVPIGRFTHLKVIEDDGNRLIDRNDFIGDQWLLGRKTNGVQQITFSGDGASYVVYYEIR